MTILRIIRQAYEAAGAVSDLQYYALDPLDPSLDPADLEYHPNWCQLVDMFNDALIDIVTWKFSDNRQLRFRFLEEYASFSSMLTAGVITSIGGNIFTWTGVASAVTDYYKGWLLTQASTSAAALVLRSYTVAGINYLILATTTNFVAGVCSLSKREYSFVDTPLVIPVVPSADIAWDYQTGSPLEILDVIDASSSSSLEQKMKFDPQLAVSPARGTPTGYYKLARGVRFDSWPDASLSYLVRFIRSPRKVQYIDDPTTTEIELPEQFHEAIYLSILVRLLRREEMSADCYSVKKDVEDFLRRKITGDGFQDSYHNGQMKLYQER